MIAEFFNYGKIWKMVTDFFKEVSASAVQASSSIKKLSMTDACSFSVIIVGPRICGVNHFPAKKIKKFSNFLVLVKFEQVQIEVSC